MKKKEKNMKNWKQNKGSVTLFVLISILFFVGILLTVFVSTNQLKITQTEASKQLKQTYAKEIARLPEVYQMVYDALHHSTPIPEEDNARNANPPKLTSHMTPIKWDGNDWIATVETDPDWYDYSKEQNKWANAILNYGTTYAQGTILNESDLTSMYVWIPRFSHYTSSGGLYFEQGTGGKSVHKAFSKDYYDLNNNTEKHKELTGFWISKFRNTGANSGELLNSQPGKTPHKASFESSFAEYYIDAVANSVIAQELYNMQQHFYPTTNLDWGAVGFLTLYANNGDISYMRPADALTGYCEGIPYIDNLQGTTTQNVFGVFDMLCEEKQLINTFYTEEEMPYNDSYYIDAPNNINLFTVVFADNGGRVVEGMGLELGNGEILTARESQLVRGGRDNFFDSFAVPFLDEASYHLVISDLSEE